MRQFTPESATRALPLVRRIVGDIRTRFDAFLRLRDECSELAKHADRRAALDEAVAQLQTLQDELNSLEQELREIGCALKDWRLGLVDFPGQLDGRPVWLCWHPNEDAVTHWHEWDAGFSKRQTIADAADFALPERTRA